jgi:hypothetical protein
VIDEGGYSAESLNALLDVLMVSYLERRSCTPLWRITGHFELHSVELLRASLARLVAAGRASYDERRAGYCSRRP